MRRIALLALLAGLAACRERPDRVAVAAAAPVHVDSVIPIADALARFRADLPDAPTSLRGGAPSRDSLVRAVVEAFDRADAPALEALTVDRAEFAYLYYPTTRISRPPYELPPALAWFRLQEANRKGATRALHALGEQRRRLVGYDCDATPTIEGRNRIWSGCTVDLRATDGDTARIGLFGAILERDGRFKVLSFENDF